MCSATKENVSAGATGTQTGTFNITSGSAGYVAWTVRIPSAGGGGGATIYTRRPLSSPVFTSRIIS
jgi:hypothetical protein